MAEIRGGVSSYREYAQILNQATLQSRYSGGRKVEWHFSNPRVADFWASEFRLKGLDNIRVFYTPFDENFIPHLEKYCFFAFT
jgi:hypothetical protein